MPYQPPAGPPGSSGTPGTPDYRSGYPGKGAPDPSKTVEQSQGLDLPTLPGVVGTPTVAMPRTPNDQEMDAAGGVVETPLGTARRGGDGSTRVQLGPEGQQRYLEATVRARQRFGPLPAGIQAPPHVTPGRMVYNPFGGGYSRG